MLFENSHPTHSVFFGAMSTVLRRAFPATHRTHPAGSMTTLFRRNFVTLRRTTFPDGYSTSMKSRVGFSLLLLFLTLATASIALAQNTGTLEGRVTDARTGEPLTGATVALKRHPAWSFCRCRWILLHPAHSPGKLHRVGHICGV